LKKTKTSNKITKINVGITQNNHILKK